MLKKIVLIYATLLSLITPSFSQTKIYIEATVENEIITNYDIQKEIRYLQILNKDLINLDELEKNKIAKNSLINEIIKKKEIIKIFNFEDENLFVEQYLKDLYRKLDINNEKEFEEMLSKFENYSLDEIKKKIKVEILWNELIYSKYVSQIKIDKNLLEKKIDNLVNKTRKEYLLSEIIFMKPNDENFDKFIKKIMTSIFEIGFNNTANIYSIAESSKFGGKLGWIDENNLSELISKELNKIGESEITNIINIRNNFMILKIEKIRLKEISINKQNELNKMIKYETNKQLNQFSRIYFEKSKINYTINEN
ncbi:peptidylprolyl isomerase [Candidatus Pelagibacter sp.]|nr:peptidylprolyl isomerase [Candidatus Pelagibacter sp.]